MKRQDFHFELPDELIARYPREVRSQSRLMHINAQGEIKHRVFLDLSELLTSKDLLIFNNTRVIPARLFGAKESGGKVEILVERVLDPLSALAHVKSSKSPKPGAKLFLDKGFMVEVLERQEDLFVLQLVRPLSTDFDADQFTVLSMLKEIGHVPLPPYLNRADESSDQSRYQTVYAQEDGAVAAPTAGLHFDDIVFESLRKRNVQTGFVTLHVGAGTFQPVRAENVRDHKMHKEYLEVDAEVCEKVNRAREEGGRVIAVGTTSVRCLETAFNHQRLEPYQGDTDIFIYPGYEFCCVDALVTNFHLPESSLMMLVSAFSGHQEIMRAYQAAIEEKYRFYSYGDAMFLEAKASF